MPSARRSDRAARDHGADEGVAEQGCCHGPREQGEIVTPPAPEAAPEQQDGQQHRDQRHRHVNSVDRRKVELPALLVSGAHRLELAWDITLDDP